MQQVTLGQNGPVVGRVGLGCMSFGGIYGTTDIAESHETLACALDLGVTHLDVANIYGSGISEAVIGAFFRSNPGIRMQFTIATKAAIVSGPPREFRNDAAHLRKELEASLTRLGTDHVELFYIHRRDHRVPVEDVMETLTSLIKEGKIGAIGFSEIAPTTLEKAAAIYPVAAVQSEYSLWTRQPELGMLQLCQKLGTSFVSFSPVGRGMLTDTDIDRSSFPPEDFRNANPRFLEPNLSVNQAKVAALRDFARQKGVATATLAVAWTLAKAPGSIAIPGTRTATNLAECAAASDLNLTSEDLHRLEQLLPPGWAHGSRYSDAQWPGVEDYC